MQRYIRIAAMLLGVAAVWLAVGCTPDTGRRKLAVSVPAQTELLRRIAGDDFEIVTVLSKGADPESFDPTVRTRADVEDSRIYFAAGYLPFEEKITASLGDGVTVVNTAEGITPLYGTHGHIHSHGEGHDEGEAGHNHEAADPHTWVSVKNARVIAANMYKALLEAYPADSQAIGARYRTLDAGLDSLDRALAAQLEPHRGEAFAIWHPSLGYFARDYGLEQIAVGFENKEMSPQRMSDIKDDIARHGARVFIFQQDYNSPQMRQFGNALGLSECPVNLMAPDWDVQLKKVADAVAR